jgi:uncharacterized protein (TIGR00297 family)
MQLLIGFITAILIAYLAYRFHSLNQSGAYTAALIGTIVFGLGGWQWAILLITFFVTSSVLTKSFRKNKQFLDEKYSKSGRRDAGQVLSNGALAALFVVLHASFPEVVLPWLGFAASLAAVNADTWATELGVLSPVPPRMITSLHRRVERGTSGGISLLGTFAAILGAALIGVLAGFLSPGGIDMPLALLVTFAGLLGSLLDSLLGATVQAMYSCPFHQKETEKYPLHTCGTQTVHIRGWRWLNNDWVNFACSAFAVAVALPFHIF